MLKNMKSLTIILILILILSISISLYFYRSTQQTKAQNKKLTEYIEKIKEERDKYHKENEKYLLQDETSKLRQLNFKKTLDYTTIDKTELKNMLQKKVEEELAGEGESIEDYEKILVKFGFLEPGDHLMPYITALYSEQVQGMYDQDTGKMILVEGLPLTGSMQRMFMVHELTHVLQDHHFVLNSLPLQEENEDRAQAALALVEGDATLVMFLYYKDNFKVRQLLWDIVSYLSIDQTQVNSSPYFIRENLLFPYKWGIKFVTQYYTEGGWNKINQIIENPPESTEQILHPEKYGLDKPVDVKIEEEKPEGWRACPPDLWRELERNTMGEFNIGVILAMHLGEYESTTPSSGWGGDEYIVWENRETGELRAVWDTVWDTQKDAEEFFNAYRKLLRKRRMPKARIKKQGNNVKINW